MFHFCSIGMQQKQLWALPSLPTPGGRQHLSKGDLGVQNTACFPGPWNGLAQHIKKDPDICVPLTLPKVASLAGSTAL